MAEFRKRAKPIQNGWIFRAAIVVRKDGSRSVTDAQQSLRLPFNAHAFFCSVGRFANSSGGTCNRPPRDGESESDDFSSFRKISFFISRAISSSVFTSFTNFVTRHQWRQAIFLFHPLSASLFLNFRNCAVPFGDSGPI